MYSGKGDTGRLRHILEKINENKLLYTSDQKYLDDLILRWYPDSIEKFRSELKKVNENIKEIQNKIAESNVNENTTETNDSSENLQSETVIQTKRKSLAGTIAKILVGAILLLIGLPTSMLGSQMMSSNFWNPLGGTEIFGGLIIVLIGLVFVIPGIRLIARA